MSQLARTAALECQVTELESRLHTLETTWKTAIEKERREHEKQMAEVVQVLMIQQELYNERTATLKSRLDEAIKLCHSAAAMHQAAIPASQPSPSSVVPAKQSAGLLTDRQPQSSTVDALPTIPSSYQSRVDRIFDFYTAADVLRPRMGMQTFCRLLRDCRVGLLDSGTSPELLWIVVMRALQNKPAADYTAPSGESQQAALFTHLRQETFGRARFSEALSAVAMELHRLMCLSVPVPAAKNGLAQSAQDTCLVFLTGVVFPRTADVMRRASTAGSAPTDPNDAVTHYESVIGTYDSAEEVKTVLRRYASNIRRTFEASVTDPAAPPCRSGGPSPGMSAAALSETARRYKLLPHLSKMDLRAIFDTCAAWERTVDSDATNTKDDPQRVCIFVPGFTKALCCIAERIYGDTAVASLYPTPASRVTKLMTKMFVLS